MSVKSCCWRSPDRKNQVPDKWWEKMGIDLCNHFLYLCFSKERLKLAHNLINPVFSVFPVPKFLFGFKQFIQGFKDSKRKRFEKEGRLSEPN